MNKINPILQSLGLLESEVKTYLAALENGPSTAIQLSKATSLSRQAIYDAVGALSDRGIMSSVMRGKKRFYAAEHPETLLAHARKKQQEMESQVKDLERMIPDMALRMGGERPIVRMFEGKASIQAIIEDMKQTDIDHMAEITDLNALYSVLSPEDLKDMRTALKERNVKGVGIYAGTPSAKIVDSNRFILGDEYKDFKANIGVYGNKIEMLTYEGKVHAVIVESDLLAKTMKILFDLAVKQMRSERREEDSKQ